MVNYRTGKAPVRLLIWRVICSSNHMSALLHRCTSLHSFGFPSLMLMMLFRGILNLLHVLGYKLLRNTGLAMKSSVVLLTLISLNWMQPRSCSMPSSATARVTLSSSTRWSGSWSRRSTSWNCACSTETCCRAPACGPSPVNSLRRGGMSTRANHVEVYCVDVWFFFFFTFEEKFIQKSGKVGWSFRVHKQICSSLLKYWRRWRLVFNFI